MEHALGYSDLQRYLAEQQVDKPAPASTSNTASVTTRAETSNISSAAARTSSTPKKKLSYNEQREFETLPAHIEALEHQKAELETAVNDPDFYKKGADTVAADLARLEELTKQIEQQYARWADLESLIASFQKS